MRVASIHARAFRAGMPLAGLALLWGAMEAGAVVCTYTPLTSGVSVSVPAEGFYSFEQTEAAWTAVAVWPTAGTDWDLFAYATTAADPFCLAGDLASSYRVHGVDFVVGDFHHDPLGTYYAGPTRPGGSGAGVLEWDNGADAIVVDAAPVMRTASGGDVVEVWDVALEAGQTYTIAFERAGAADVRALLFRNPGTAYWASRDARVLEIVGPEAYTAPATDVYGIVVVNDDGGDGSYQLAVLQGLVDVPAPSTPAHTSLRAIAPNPIHDKGSIHFDLSSAGRVGFEVVDVSGRVVERLEEQRFDAGRWSRSMANLEGLAPGVYFLRMSVDGRIANTRSFIRLE